MTYKFKNLIYGNIANPSKIASLVLFLVAVVWLIAQWLGHYFSWDFRLAFVFDSFAFLGFLWVMLVVFRVWRVSKKGRKN